MQDKNLNYSDYLEIADGIYWVGFVDEQAHFHCNPYLIVDNNEAVLIDGGSRNDFSTVMLKIMRTGTDPRNIKRVIYQHDDPDLCGNIPHMKALIRNNGLRIVSHKENHIFINCCSPKSSKDCIEDLGFRYRFASGRELLFIQTPYSHSPGSFVTYDSKTKVLFSSDLFGSYDTNWNLYSSIFEKCADCTPERICPITGKPCEIIGVWDFHRYVMTSTKALRFALKQIDGLDISLIAPQRGSVFHTPASCKIVTGHLSSLTGVGIDYFLMEEECS